MIDWCEFGSNTRNIYLCPLIALAEMLRNAKESRERERELEIEPRGGG